MNKKIIKKIIACSFVFLMIILCGCSNSAEDDKSTLAEIKAWINETVRPYITEDMTLPSTHPVYGGTITWSSTDPDILSDSGEIIDRGTKVQEAEIAYIIDYNGALDSDYMTIHISPITLEEAVTKFEKVLQKRVIDGETEYFVQRDIDIPTDYYGIITIETDSSNKDVFSNEGKYMKPNEDTNFTLKVKLTDSYRSIDKEYEVVAYGKSALDKINEGIEWLDNNFVDMLLTAETGLPNKTENGCVITWTSSNEEIVSSDGKVTESPFERYVSLKAKLSLEDSIQYREYYCKVQACDTSKMTETEKLEAYLKAITVSSYSKINFSYGSDITQNYGYLNFFDGTDPEIIEAVIPDGTDCKPDVIRTETAFITVHDTGNSSKSATALMHSNYLNRGCDGRQVSWHYSVGDDVSYHQVNDDEVAWHAGDGSRTFKLIDTGVKATAKMPLLTFSDDDYFVLGGQKTNIKIPSDTKNKRVGPYGIYTIIGENGNYWMNNAYYNSTYGYICNCGGNRNSVSMETCVNTGSNYVKTYVNAAKITVKLLRKYNLTCDCIMQHNNFSGKDCPQMIRSAGQWSQFRDLCSLMKYGLDNFSDYKFEWTSSDVEKITNDGFIALSCNKGETLNYSVKVLKNNITIVEQSFTTILA